MKGFDVLALALPTVALAFSTVQLPYGKVEGVPNLSSFSGATLAHPLTAFFSVPYASAPRFEYPGPPATFSGVRSLKDYGPVCPQATSSFPASAQSEDCLSLSIFIPEGTTPDAALPVVVWIHGGSFNTGAGRSLNLPSMVGNAPADSRFIGVSINYRLGALGFLPSTITHDAARLNIGLIDQREALYWVQRNIAKFGGSPQKVTLFGESAGAHSVGFHLLNVQPNPALFRAVIMDSGGPTARTYPSWTYPLYETQMQQFLEEVGCTGKANAGETFKCLKALDIAVLRDTSASLYNSYNPSLRWPFQPVVSGNFVAEEPSRSWAEGKFNKVPILTGYNTNEGHVFVPQDLKTTADFRAFFSPLIPRANATILNQIESLYPSPDSAGSPYANSPISPQFSRASFAYGDFAYLQAVQTNAIAASNFGVNVYKYHFDQPSSPGGPVNHGSELPYVTRTASNTALATVMNRYYASFIVTGNPNSAGAAHWPAYTSASPNQLLLKGEEASLETDNVRHKQLAFWRSIPDVLAH